MEKGYIRATHYVDFWRGNDHIPGQEPLSLRCTDDEATRCVDALAEVAPCIYPGCNRVTASRIYEYAEYMADKRV